MRSVFALVFLVGVALAGLAVYVVQGYVGAVRGELARQQASMPQVVETTAVYVATKQLKYGQVLDPNEDVKLVNWPTASLPEAAFTKETTENPLFADAQAPRTVLRVIEPGEPILAVKVTAPGQQAGLTALLEPGMRAFTVKVDRATGMAGFLRPGDTIDVYWTGVIGQIKDAQSDDEYDGSISRLIHRNL
jgi:pilus assembly protein CpaB